jgi:hypothetical protein
MEHRHIIKSSSRYCSLTEGVKIRSRSILLTTHTPIFIVIFNGNDAHWFNIPICYWARKIWI